MRDATSPPVQPPGIGGRARAATALVRARWAGRAARREERRALEHLGSALGSRCPAPTGEVRAAREALAAEEARLAALDAALDASLEEDRRDYAEAPAWLRPVAIVRGFATRALVRERRRRAARARAVAAAALGAAAVATSVAHEGAAAPLATAAMAARLRAGAADEEVAAQLPLVEGTPLLGVARGVAREGGALARPMAREVRSRLLPKTPALAGLAAGWWIASTFTDSELSATLHRFGLGSGPRHAVSSETLHRMEFWVPVLAAALCSYLGDRVATLVRRRYGAPVGAEEQAASGAAPVRRA